MTPLFSEASRHPIQASPLLAGTSLYEGPRWRADAEFAEMQRAFAPYAGMSTGDELLLRASRSRPLPISSLARPIARRELVSLMHRGQLLLPNFQFEPGSLQLLPAMTEIVLELRDVFDDWDLALWFAMPNVVLQHARPVDLLASRGSGVSEVREAARVDRFIALG